VSQEGAELDVPVACHVRIGSSPGLKLAQEILEHLLTVLAREVHVVKVDAEVCANAPGIGQIGSSRAMLVGVFPVGHVQGFDLVPGPQQAQCGHGRVDSTGQSNDDAYWNDARHGAKV
jgi:hypothetical protein